MRKFFYSLIAAYTLFGSISVSANEFGYFNVKNYIFDDEGNAQFVKVYIESSGEMYSNNAGSASSSSKQDGFYPILKRMSQNDQRGRYIVVPIKNRRARDDDDDT